MSSCKNIGPLTREQRANLAHALMHLEANAIADERCWGGWHVGNREQFVKRHRKAIAMLHQLLAVAAPTKADSPG